MWGLSWSPVKGLALPSRPEDLLFAFSLQMASMKMFQIQFHTGFVPRNAATVKFAKYVGVTLRGADERGRGAPPAVAGVETSAV